MAVTNEDIQNWFKANPNASDAEIFRVMQANKVSQEQLVSAMNFNPVEVQSTYLKEQAAATPVVTPPVVTAPVVTAPVVTAPVVTAPVVTQTPETEAQWKARQPTEAYLNTLPNAAERSKVFQGWQKQRPGYVDPMDFNTYEQYIAAANPTYKMGTDAGNDLQNQANFYGLTIENYLNTLSGDPTKPMGANQSVYGAKLLSPLQRLAAETARGQGISAMSPETAALARANPDVFNEASRAWSNYLKTTFPGTLEYESALAGPMQYSATGVTMPKTSPANSMYFLDPVTKQITKNPNYKPTALATAPAPVQLGTAPVAPGLIGTRPVGVKDVATTLPTTPGGSTGLFGAPVVNGTTQGLLGEIENLPLGSYAGSYAPIQKSYESFMGIPAGAQFNPAITTEGQSPYKFLQNNWTDLKNVYAGQLPYTSMGGYNPALYVDLAKENKRMADITAAQAIQQQLNVLNASGDDGGAAAAAAAAAASAADSAAASAASATGDAPGSDGSPGSGAAMGGLITSVWGENPPGPDDGAKYLDIGEYVIKKSSVNKYGRGLLNMINEGKVPAKKMKSLLG